MCQSSEAQARRDIVKEWATFTEAAKGRCLELNAHPAPSYVELLACLEAIRNMQDPARR